MAAGACSRDGGRGAADSCRYRQYKYKLVAACRKEGHGESKRRLRSKRENYFQASLRSRPVRYAAKGSCNSTVEDENVATCTDALRNEGWMRVHLV